MINTRGLAMLLVALAVVAVACACNRPADPVRGAEKSHLQKPDRDAEEHSRWVLQDEGQAIAKALEVFGISAAEAQQVEAQVVTLDDDNTPFLHGQITKRPLWLITISKYGLRPQSAPVGERDLYERTFDVLLDPRDGKLLKIISRWPEGAPPESAPEPRAAFAEQCFADSGLEIYHCFPDFSPKITFLEAIDAIYTRRSEPRAAKQIVAHYVVQSSMGRDPQQVWAITLRGIPPIRAAYPGVSIAARDHMRHIVDAESGKWLGAGTSPQPEGPPVPEQENGEGESADTPPEDEPSPYRP